MLSSEFSRSRQLSRTHISGPGKILDDVCNFRILQFCEMHDILVVLVREIQHARLILAKHHPPFRLVYGVSDGLGKMAQLQELSASERVLCVVRTNQPDNGPRYPWSLV